MVKHYAPIKIPGYEDLIAPPPPEKPEPINKVCSSCEINMRHRLKSGEYDSYCAECRSKKNKKYGSERRAIKNRFIK